MPAGSTFGRPFVQHVLHALNGPMRDESRNLYLLSSVFSGKRTSGDCYLCKLGLVDHDHESGGRGTEERVRKAPLRSVP